MRYMEAETRAISRALTEPKHRMEQKFELPPNIKDIVAVFPAVKLTPGVIFTYGLIIFNPDRVELSPALWAHEQVHSRRQGIGDGPSKWWDQYLANRDFRFQEEVLAHQIEYVVATENQGRQVRRRMLAKIAERLASPLYGRMTTKDEAKRQIKGEVDVAAI